MVAVAGTWEVRDLARPLGLVLWLLAQAAIFPALFLSLLALLRLEPEDRHLLNQVLDKLPGRRRRPAGDPEWGSASESSSRLRATRP